MSAEALSLPRPSLIPPNLRPLLLLIGVAAAVAAGVGVVLWSKEPTYSLLYGNLSQTDSAQIAQALQTSGIPYKLDNNGEITVPAEHVHDARLKLAGQGLPEGDGGFAVMSKDPGFGVSQFMEGARYQHALETELARTIASLQPVEAARVHLALPRQSAFVRDRRPPSASVLLQLKAGRRLEQEQVTAIVNLVASSIPELEANQVTVIDQQGRLLSSPEGTQDEFAVRSKQLDMARDMEERYTHRIEELLAPLVGPGRVRAQVVADVEMSTTEEAREQYRPDSQIVRSEQTAEETSRNGAGPQGVPGSLTNQPPTPGVALPPGASTANAPVVAQAATPLQPGQAPPATQAPAPSPPDNTSKQATRNYEIDRTVAYTKLPAGRLKRITVAVLIDNLRTTDDEGKVTETELTADQVTNITRLVKDAVGFDQGRGDSVNVVNASFKGEQVAEELKPETIPLWERPLVRDIAKLLAGLIVLLALVFMVLRPLVRGLLAAPRTVYAPAALSDGTTSDQGGQSAAVPVMDYDGQINQARTLVTQDPARVAQVVKTWVGSDE
ncbi:MAG: flagellar basal-body MS-ring/collar protein FliF [Povalibacter sp.]